MKNTVNLTSRAKMSIILCAQKCAEKGLSTKESINAIQKRMIELKLVEKTGEYNAMLAISIAFYRQAQAKINGVKAIDTLKEYARFKYWSMVKLSDFGAFADVAEILVRLYCKPEWSISYNDVHVKQSYSIDCTIRGNKCEIGTNGKTFAESVEGEPMRGKFDYVVYGVFAPYEKERILKMLMQGETRRALDEMAKKMYVFEKNDFYEFMTTKTGRGAMIAYKPLYGYYQVVYNDSKHDLFREAVKREHIPTLAEWLK